MSSKKIGIHELIAEAACALAEDLFPTYDDKGDKVASLAHAHVLVAGRADAWAEWPAQSQHVQRLIGRLVYMRPNALGSSKRFSEVAYRVADRVDSGYRLPSPVSVSASDYLVPRHGQRPLDFAETLLGEAEMQFKKRRTAAPTATAGYWRFGSNPQSYVYLDLVSPAEVSPVTLQTTAMIDKVSVSANAILALADQIDKANKVQPWRREVIARLFAGLRDRNDKPVESLTLMIGPTEVLNAPTGVGKSVLIALLAMLLAKRGIPVGIVIGNIKDAQNFAQQISKQAALLGECSSDPQGVLPRCQTPITCTALISERRIHDRALDAAAREQWARFDALAYGCVISASIRDGKAPKSGEEPCNRLLPHRSASEEKKDERENERHLCPYISRCGRFQSLRDAALADIIVTNHHNFVQGMITAPVDVDGHTFGRLSVVEFMMRRCPVILVDEVDHLQSIMFDSGARGLVLADSTDSASVPPLTKIDTQRARLSAAQNREVLPPVFRTRYLAEQLLNYVLTEDFRFDRRKRAERRVGRSGSGWYVPGSNDRFLLQHLFPDEDPDEEYPEQIYAQFDSLFPYTSDAARVALPNTLRPLAKHLRVLVSNDHGDDRVREVKRALTPLVTRVLRQGLSDLRECQEVVNALVVRTWLGELHKALTALTYAVSAHDTSLPAAEALRNQLGRFVQHATIPFGPLDHLLFGFRVDRSGEDPGRGTLSVQASAGDPHTTVQEMGRMVALANTGAQRIVFGLSATAYFPRAARKGLLTAPKYAMTDLSPGAFKAASGVTLGDGRPMSVGGQREQRKPNLVRELGRNLWDQHLDAHLRCIAERDSQRERCLLVVNSYPQVKALAAGIAERMPQPNWVAVVVHNAEKHTQTAWGEVRITADELEDLPNKYPSVKVCIAPLSVVARGLNILIPGTSRSALASIWICVRPRLQLSSPSEILASVNARALTTSKRGIKDDPAQFLELEKQIAARRLQELLTADRRFTRLPDHLKAEVVAGVTVEIIQLGGRARRGGTDMEIYFVDNALLDASLGSDFRSVLGIYYDKLSTSQKQALGRLYGSTFDSLLDFAGVAHRKSAGA